MDKNKCEYSILCFKKATGTIEKTWVTTRRFRVCESCAKKVAKKYEEEKWRGGMVEKIEYIKD